ncbi:glycosyltransferase family 2 protein [Membranicola marinus]|uniref:Glycosyltransferase family 2 protein n=1 Tax=Membranihabitans marinus TaxID=1227546 RepID=A0A953LDS9_9BACT|nr:glycosyltransferase family A protein [Membranihabitans marinus]MBY5959204.1 glycosyltransferase family 2 protein [Membranihabitans marinus]
MNDTITIIISVWKREYLDEQLQSLVHQTIRPQEIWILQDKYHIDISSTVNKYKEIFPDIHLVHSDINFKYFWRFSLCIYVKTKYTLIIDDDVIPSPTWLDTCLKKCKEYNAVISCTGRIIKPFHEGEVRDLYFIGDVHPDHKYNFQEDDTMVDYGCNSFFFKTGWIKDFWHIWPSSFASGEDMHLSSSLKILRSIPTVVPQQLSKNGTGNLNKYYSRDQFSSWRAADFRLIRESIVDYLLVKGWKPLMWGTD